MSLLLISNTKKSIYGRIIAAKNTYKKNIQ